MKQLLLDDKLIEIEHKIQSQITPQLRAEALRSFLSCEEFNLKNGDLINSTSFISKDLNKVELENELTLSIKLISFYLKNESFELDVSPNFKFKEDLNNKLRELKKRIKEIIYQHQNDILD